TGRPPASATAAATGDDREQDRQPETVPRRPPGCELHRVTLPVSAKLSTRAGRSGPPPACPPRAARVVRAAHMARATPRPTRRRPMNRPLGASPRGATRPGETGGWGKPRQSGDPYEVPLRAPALPAPVGASGRNAPIGQPGGRPPSRP